MLRDARLQLVTLEMGRNYIGVEGCKIIKDMDWSRIEKLDLCKL